jgi:hypothetical protein
MIRSPQPIQLLPILAAILLLAGPVAALGPVGVGPSDGGQVQLDRGSSVPAADTVVTVANATNYLMPQDGAALREETVRADVDVAAAVGTGTEQLRGEFERGAFRRSWSGTSASVKRELVSHELGQVRAELARLQADERTLRTDFQNGSIDSATFLRRSSLINVRATELSRRLERVQQLLSLSTRAPYISDYQTPLDNIRSRITTVRNPVIDGVNHSLWGVGPGSDTYLLVGSEAYVIGTTAQGEFRRVAHADVNRMEGTDTFAADGDQIIAALNRFKTLYPWADENAIRNARVFNFGNTSIYRGRIVHPQGELTAYVDGTTRNVFREVQVIRRGAVPVENTIRSETDALILTVNTTGATGPMKVELRQAGTKAPLNGTVRLDGRVIGETGQSGTFWTVQPRGEFAVNATVDADSVEVDGP